MLGERIREIRKMKKMTLEGLAGEELTKGMLSLIENNKAKPSMESLTYIAKRLGVEVTELLEEISGQELRGLLETAEKLYNSAVEQCPDKYKQLISSLDPYMDKLNGGYEAARLLDIYGRCRYHEQFNDWNIYCKRAAKMYDEMNLTAKRAGIGILYSTEKFVKHEYTESLKIFLAERATIEAKHAYVDPITRADLDYQEAILYFAVGDSESAKQVMEKAIQFSKEHRIFYRIDDLYRLAVAHAMMTKDEENKLHYLKKLKQYGDFADHTPSILFYDLFKVMSLMEKQDYYASLEIIDHYLSNPKTTDFYEVWFLLEKGKALYSLRRFLEAIPFLEKMTIPSWVHHPFDLSLLYVKDCYKALCLFELGHDDEALHAAKHAVNHFELLPQTPFKDFAHETYNRMIENIKENKPAED
ncbi:helix-turn-helix transcriptional regulator [Bacillus sp. 1P10SD]|uniref:helix-turn-helix domain-containing protein n=1 Tax=Bacillus sp. 1P10SD TaxID=3132265 RepID=UPI0039A6284A